ncbi:MAG: glycosyltransferase family 2 protein [Bacillota bacterium]
MTNSRNPGYAVACNQGYDHSQGLILVFLNNDTVVTSN